MFTKTSLISALFTLFFSTLTLAAPLNTGTWRFELRAPYGTVPFIMHIEKHKDKYQGVLENGKEKIKLTDIKVEDKKVTIPLQTYEMVLKLEAPEPTRLEGYLVRENKDPVVTTPVIAAQGVDERFPEEKKKPTIDLNGRWAVTLTEKDPDKDYKGVIIFEQKDNKLSGSILTPTGDYRYMEGFVSGNEFEAASFDGVYNYLVKGEVKDGKLEAKILSGYLTLISGKKDPKAHLPDAYKQTQIDKLSFTFPDLKGKKVSLSDKKFNNKPVIVQFFGSWCPNCMDEMNYLIPWYKKNHKRGIEIIALAFERSLGDKEAKVQLLKTQKKKQIPYPLLIAGTTSKDKPADKIPGLKNFISFPTTIFLNKKHEVVKVHAGFTGPSTGEFYETWKKEFNKTVDEILK